MGVAKLIKKCMVDCGRDDFCTYLGQILGVSKAWAGKKLSGKSKFTVDDLNKIMREFDIGADELKQAILGDDW